MGARSTGAGRARSAGVGVSKVTQYKLDVPAPYRDAAVWIGPIGIGKPALSEQRQVKQREDAYRRIGEAHARLAAPYKKVEAAAKKPEAAAKKPEAAAAADQQHKAPDPTPRN